MSIKDIKRWFVISFHSLFWGMKGAEDIISGQNTDSNDSSYSQKGGNGGVFQNLLEEEQTQQVKELRDEYYRIIREADRYKVNLIVDNEGNLLEGSTVRKKTKSDFVQHCDVDETDGLKIRLIQDNVRYQKDILDDSTSLYDAETTLNIERTDFIPRFRIEQFVTKIVVKEETNTTAVIDLYAPAMASQFGKIDAIFIANMTQMMEKKDYKNDILDINRLSFCTYKPWGVENGMNFEYDNLKVKEIFVYDGKFVIKYEAHIVKDGEYIGKKYEMDTVTEKYDNRATKAEAVNIFALNRKIEKENNLENSLFNNENSN